MKIYAQEIKDGLKKQISSQASVSYASLVEPSPSKKNHKKDIKALAGIEDRDLYYVQSILVTSNWNKNDDIFDSGEVWLAKATPEDKPTNLEHDEASIVGHITSNWPITDDGILIDPETPLENLPEKFHILTGSVIYRTFASEELKDRTEALIDSIEDGTKYVSMECFFNGFDYGIQDKSTGSYKVVARSEETAHLTKYLKAYGGMGEHEDFKIGRVLRSITFSGKGYVDRPANPESIIFNSKTIDDIPEAEPTIDDKPAEAIMDEQEHTGNNLNMKNNEIEKNGVIASELVSTHTENLQMNEELETKVADLESVLASKQKELEQVTASIAECESLATQKDEELKAATAALEVSKAEFETMKTEFDAANEAIAAYKDKEEEMKKKAKKDHRMATLLDAGIETTEAEAFVDKFESVDDDAFSAMTSLLAAKKPPFMKEDEEKDKKKEEKKEEASEEAVVSEEVLETVEEDAEAIDLAVGGEEESQIESTRAALVDFVYSTLGKSQNKGE